VFGGGPYTIGGLALAEQVAAPTMTRLVVGLERDARDLDSADEERRAAARGRGAAGAWRPWPRRSRSWTRTHAAAALERGVGIVERIVGGGPAAWNRQRKIG